MSKPSTMRDVARQAKVDVSVVSRLLNEDPNLRISDSTRRRVEAAIKDHNYSPNLTARALRTSRGRSIVYLFRGLANPLYGRVIATAQRAAVERGYLVVLTDVAEIASGAAFDRWLVQSRQGGVAGVVIASSAQTELGPERCRKLSAALPVVDINGKELDADGVAAVDADSAMRMALEHLHKLGHRAIALVSGPTAYVHVGTRRTAYLAWMRERGLPDQSVQATDDASPVAGENAGIQLLTDSPETTGLVTTHFMLGMGILRAAARYGRPVPGTLSVVALFDHELAGYSGPPLTTVDLPVEQQAECTVDRLISIIEGTEPTEIVRRPPNLIIRESTGRYLPSQSSPHSSDV